MTGAMLALRAAIVVHCAADPALRELLDGGIRDEPPRGAVPVFAHFGPSESRDASTSDGGAATHAITVRVWAREGSTASGLLAADRIAELLHDAALPLAGHGLVFLLLDGVETARDGATGLARTVLRFRALTEAR